jgi:Predicted transcriptional regulators
MRTEVKSQNLRKKASILKGLAHPVRIAIAEMLDGREICACEIADQFVHDRTTVSKHLALMTNLGILEARKDGPNIFYTLKMRCIVSILECIDGVVERGVCCED